MNKIIYIFMIVILLPLNLKCYNILIRNNNLTIKEIEIYKNTKIWDLAIAVQTQNLKDIKRLANKKNINFRDTIFDCNLLTWAVYNQKYESTKLLLELGADPNYCSEKILLKEKINPLILTSIMGNTRFSFRYDNFHLVDSTELTDNDMLKYAELILNYTKKHINCEVKEKNHPLSALSHASANNHEVFKLLIKNGGKLHFDCSIHYFSPFFQINLGNRIDNLSYAIYNNFVDLNKPLYYDINNKPVYILKLLRSLKYRLGTSAHKMKMELVDFLKTKGLDYNKEPIPARIRKENNKEYLDKY